MKRCQGVSLNALMLAKTIRVYQLFAQALELCPLPRTDTSEDTYNKTMVKCHTIIIPIAVMFYDNRKPSSFCLREQRRHSRHCSRQKNHISRARMGRVQV